MPKAIYLPHSQLKAWRLLSPISILRDLYAHRELIVAYTKREYEATHRNTFLGAAWSMLSPLILLALFTFVFGYVFQGRFSGAVDETAGDFAIALFVGLALFLCFGQVLNQAPGLMLANSTYVKTLAFPVEILPVALVAVLLINLLISLGLCLLGFLFLNGFLHWTTIFVVFHVVAVTLMALGLAWFLSALGVFIRDTPAVTSPLSMVLMFMSGVFFSITSLPPHLQILFKVNPLAVLIYQARQAMLYGEVPNMFVLAGLLAGSVVCASLGYYFFNRSKIGFSDVL